MILAATGLTVRRGPPDRDVLRGVDVEVRPGEVLGLLGPNGAGKTTLLRALHGAERPAAGDVRLDGRSVPGADPGWIARRVGVVPQSVAPRFPYVVLDYVAMGRFPFRGARATDPDRAGGGTAQDDARAVASALARADVADLADRTVDRLSGGEFRRVLLAQVLAQEPAVLLLDEPLQQLDLAHQIETLRLLRALAAEGCAVAVVLHDLDVAARVCDRLLVLAQGTAVAVGAPDAVLTADLLRSVWDVDAAVVRCEVTGAMRVAPRDAGRPTGRGAPNAPARPVSRSSAADRSGIG